MLILRASGVWCGTRTGGSFAITAGIHSAPSIQTSPAIAQDARRCLTSSNIGSDGCRTHLLLWRSQRVISMPVAMGILCERCRRVYFISPSAAESSRIHYDHKRGDFKLFCRPPCNMVVHFHRSMLRAYSVSNEVLALGYADIRDCQSMSEVQVHR